LDAQTRVQLQQHLLDTWSDAQRTVVFVTHDVDEAVFLANRVIVMSRYPGEIYKEFRIDLPYPRTQALRTTAEFFALRTQVWQTVYDLADTGPHISGR
jgi:NitT/TauT family transport system ATP-binding protein